MSFNTNASSHRGSAKRKLARWVDRQTAAPQRDVPPDVCELINELSVYQMELEMQNDELQRRQRELERARDRTARLYDSAPYGLVTLDADCRISDANRTFMEMTGDLEPLGRMFTSYLPEPELSVFVGRYSAFFRDPSSKSMETRLEGSSRTFYARLGARRELAGRTGQDGLPDYLFLAIEDISAQKEAERALQAIEVRWQFALEGSGEGVWDWEPLQDRMYFSPRWLSILGMAGPGPAPGLGTWLDRVHPEDVDRVREALLLQQWRDCEELQIEFRIRHSRGTYLWVLTRGKPMAFDSNGRATRVIGTMADVTGRREAEARLHQAQKMESIGRLAGGIAHDFNNLLTVINGYAGMLATRPQEDPEGQRIAREILNAGERAAALTSQLLVFSRQRKLEPQPVEIDAVISGLEGMLRRLLGAGVELHLEVGAGGATVLADESQLGQILLNLCANARDAMPEGGHLLITTALETGGAREAEPPLVVLSVTDSGTGMDQAVRERAFDPFFTTKGVGKGTGLGLSIVHGVATDAGGRVEIDSTPQRGTTVQVMLPVAGEAGERPKPDAARIRRGHEWVLVVEDTRDVASFVELSLRQAGYRVSVAYDAEQAFEMCLREPGIELVLTDVIMPRKNGLELTSQLLEARPELRVLLMSGYVGEVRPPEQIHGRYEFIGKPFSLAQLTEKMGRLLERKASAAGQG